MDKNAFKKERMMMKYAIDEIKMAEGYMYLARDCEPAIATKLQEIAKDELRHYDFIKQTLTTKLSTNPDKGIMGELLQEVYDEWICDVKEKVNTFKA